MRSCEACGSSIRGTVGVNRVCSPCAIEAGEKVCGECLEVKPLDEFHRAKSKLAGRAVRCKACHNSLVKAHRAKNPDAYREATRRYYAKNPLAWRKRLVAKYGITLEDFDQMVEEQSGCCALCYETLDLGPKTHIDHDHETGRVRKILCHHCNTGLGNLRDDPDLLLRAAIYILNHREAVTLP